MTFQNKQMILLARRNGKTSGAWLAYVQQRLNEELGATFVDGLSENPSQPVGFIAVDPAKPDSDKTVMTVTEFDANRGSMVIGIHAIQREEKLWHPQYPANRNYTSPTGSRHKKGKR